MTLDDIRKHRVPCYPLSAPVEVQGGDMLPEGARVVSVCSAVVGRWVDRHGQEPILVDVLLSDGTLRENLLANPRQLRRALPDVECPEWLPEEEDAYADSPFRLEATL